MVIVFYPCVPRSGDELFTDIYKVKLISGVLYEVEGKVPTMYMYVIVKSKLYVYSVIYIAF